MRGSRPKLDVQYWVLQTTPSLSELIRAKGCACAGAHKLAARLAADAPLEEKQQAMCKLHSLLFGGVSEGNRAAAEVRPPLSIATPNAAPNTCLSTNSHLYRMIAHPQAWLQHVSEAKLWRGCMH